MTAPAQDPPPGPSEALDVERLELSALAPGRVHRLRVAIIESGAGRWLRVPVLVARGAAAGPVVGITAAVHGNELNGIPAIHRLFAELDPAALRGTVVAVPIVNLPGFHAHQRELRDGSDLNREFPGKPEGPTPQVYAHRFLERVVRPFEVLLDLHTASFGRVNSLYVRADMTRPRTAELARLIGPQIIVHNPRSDGTLRSAAEDLGIHAVTVEVGDPQRFQGELIASTRVALRDVLEHLGMVAADAERNPPTAALCVRSYWLHTDTGGLLEVFPELAERVRAGQPLARVTDAWGDVRRVYHAPEDAIVIGKSTNPVGDTGARIVHLGVEGAV